MNKVLFLGIDALDSEILEALAEELPTFTRLRREAQQLKVISTFPPDSDTAWATISTGLNPAQHGIVHFVDPLEKVDRIQNKGVDNTVLQGKTFWEKVSKAGYKTQVLFPHLCYPLWDVPEVMVARGLSQTGVQAKPPDILKEYPRPDLINGVKGFPERGVEGLKHYAEKLEALARADAEFALKRLKENDWDLFFVYWSTLDAVGHFFWNYYDKTDSQYDPNHPLQDIIPATYRLYDSIVKDFLAAIPEDVSVIILSDHGHAGRPSTLVNINEVLRKAGFLQAHDPRQNPHISVIEASKRLAVQTVSRFGLAKLAGKVLRTMPFVKASLTRPMKIDWTKTAAYASDMSGIKAYSYGGVILNKEVIENYETTRDSVIALLKQKCVLPDGTPLLDFIARREDIYQGPFIEQYPDIVLEFKYGYGLGWDVRVPLLSRASSHNLVPGSHRGSTGTCFLRSSRKTLSDTIALEDVTPSLLRLFDISTLGLEGKSIFATKVESHD